MTHQAVESSNIESVGHDPADNVLEVKFRNGGTYRYQDVTAEMHESLVSADSVGGHLYEHIVGKCRCSKC